MDKHNRTGISSGLKNRLREERAHKGWSQKELADLLDLPDTRTVARWERGQTLPHPHYRRELSRVFGKSIEELGLLEHSSMLHGQETISPPNEQRSVPVWKVPAAFHACIGRSQEIAAICALLKRTDVRLLTILGPGGIGKTRLAVEIAEQMRNHFVDGISYVSLATLNDPALVLPAIAQGLDIQENGEKALKEADKRFLFGKQFLLIADSFERAENAVFLIEQLLTECAGVKVLVTSQVPLHLSAEHEFPLDSLALPIGYVPIEPEKLLQYAAVALFTQRAQAFLPAFRVTENNVQAVAEI